VSALQEHAYIAHRGGVSFVGGEPLHARPEAAMNVELQAGLGVKTGKIHLARRNLEMPVDEVHQAVRQIGGEVGAEIGGAILPQAPGNVDARVLFVGQLDVGIRLVVAQQDVEARLVLLDQVVLEGQRFFFVIHQDVVDIDGFADEGAGFDIA
jgi:hypothetical protein